MVTTGGVSMGDMDLIKPFLFKNGKIFFGRLNMKPGKPTTFAKYKNMLVFALPGNPTSAFVTAKLMLPLSISCINGAEPTLTPSFQVSLIPNQVKADSIRPEYHRCIAY